MCVAQWSADRANKTPSEIECLRTKSIITFERIAQEWVKMWKGWNLQLFIEISFIILQ